MYEEREKASFTFFVNFAICFRAMNIFTIPQTEESAINFSQSKEILPTNKICENGHEMKLSIVKKVRWQCPKSTYCYEINIQVFSHIFHTLLYTKLIL